MKGAAVADRPAVAERAINGALKELGLADVLKVPAADIRLLEMPAPK